MHIIKEQEIQALKLPGRDWKKLISPEVSGCKNMIMGLVIFPPGSDPGQHQHEIEEEIVYVVSGRGETKIGDEVFPLEPGMAVFTEPGVPHGVKTLGDEPLVLISVFSPPVRPGSYDKNNSASAAAK